MLNKFMINNLNEAVQYFLNKKSNENLELEVVNSISDNYGIPKYCIIKRKDNNYFCSTENDLEQALIKSLIYQETETNGLI